MRFGFILKLLALVFSLTVVIYAMRSLRSMSEQPVNSDSDSMLNLLVGEQQKLFNWCPQDVVKVEIYTENSELVRTLNSTSEISAVCELMIGPVIKNQARPFLFRPKLKAYSKSNEIVVLEMDSQDKIFQVKGMPFTSPNLNKALDRLTNP